MAFFDGGASQFAGGGFMPSQATGADTGFGGTPMQPKKSRSDQTLRAVTIKQLVKDTADTDDDNFLVDGVEATNVTVIGKILDIQNTTTYISLSIEDGTGRADVRYWINDEGSDWFNQRRAEWVPGVYVRVYGHLRAFDRKKSLVGYNIKVVRDFNEVTFHFLQCIFQHKFFTSGGSGPNTNGGGMKPSMGNDSYMSTPMGGMKPSFGGTPMASNAPSATNMSSGGFGGGNANMTSGGGGGMDQVAMDVLGIYNSPEYREDAMGLHVSKVAELLRNKFTYQQVNTAVEFLNNEGHVYGTAGDGCYRTCS